MWCDIKRMCVRPGVPDAGGLLVRALVLAVFYGAVHVAGWRQYTSFLCGTVEMVGGAVSWTACAGAVYLVAYLGAVVLAPILAIAAGLLWLWNTRVPVAGRKESV
jgi:hypothetical protein